jgi:hypothetical protein
MFVLMATMLGMCGAPVPAPAARPTATVEFIDEVRDSQVTVQITTAGGASYAVTVPMDAAVAQLARDSLFRAIVHANWVADRSGECGIKVFGVRAKGGKTDSVKALVVVAPKKKERAVVNLAATGGVTAETREGDGKPAKNTPLRGPDMGKENYVEFDFTPMPTEKGPWTLKYRVETTLNNFGFGDETGAPDGTARESLCESLAGVIEEAGFKTELVEKSKIRVYGASHDGKFYPATRGIVESPNLKKDQLPKVMNPEKKG